MNHRLNKILRLIVISAFYIPLLDLILYFSLIVRANLILERFPKINDPHPIDLGFDIHYQILGFFGETLVLISLIIGVIYGIICLFLKKNILNIQRIHFFLFILFYFFQFVIHLFEVYYWLYD